MRIKYTNEVLKAIAEMQNATNLNAKIGYQIMQRIYRRVAFPKPQELCTAALSFQKEMREHGFQASIDEAMMGVALYQIIYSVVDEQNESLPMGVVFPIIQNSKIFKERDCKELESNPFVKNIKMDGLEYGTKSTAKRIMKPSELFEYGSCLWRDNIYIPKLAMASEEMEFPCLMDAEGDCIDCVDPMTILESKRYIQNARGNVLILGCNIGYFAYMFSNKANVNSITIVEQDADTLDLFESSILPQFENGNKITTICSDYKDYLNSIKDGEYDYCLVDLGQGMEAYSKYVEIKALHSCVDCKKMKMEYWHEDDYLRVIAAIVTEIVDLTCKMTMDEEFEYVDRHESYDKWIRICLWLLMEKVEIKRPKDLEMLTNPERLKRVLG